MKVRIDFWLRFIWGNDILPNYVLKLRQKERKYFKMQKQADVESASSSTTHIKHFLVAGTSYVLRVSLLSTAVSVGLVALVILGGYSCTWYGRYTAQTPLYYLILFIADITKYRINMKQRFQTQLFILKYCFCKNIWSINVGIRVD